MFIHHLMVVSLFLLNIIYSTLLIMESLVFYVIFKIHSELPTISSRMMHQGSCSLLNIFAILCGFSFLALLSRGGAASYFSPPLRFSLGFLTQVGELQWDQMSFDPLPSLPRNLLLELHQDSSPGHYSKWCSASIFCDQQSVFYTAPLQKVMYKQTGKYQADTQVNPCIPDTSWPGACWHPKVSIPPGKLVPGGSSAMSNRSRLIWTVLHAVVCRWHRSWRGVIFNSIFRSICFILHHVRVDR